MIAIFVELCYSELIMKNRNHYYINRKSGMTWLMALCLASSAVTRIMFVGLKGTGNSLFMWSQIILPVAAALLYVYITLKNGEERLYKTAIPMWMTAAYFALSVVSSDFSKKETAVCWIILFIIGTLYTTLVVGQKGRPLYLAPLLACLAVITYMEHAALQTGNWDILIAAIPDMLLLFGLLTLVFAIRRHSGEQYYPRWGDRPDGRRIRSIEPMSQMIPYIMVERNTAVNKFADSLELSAVEEYVHQKRKEGLTSFGITHVLLASYVRALCKYPALNRFISGQKIYSRGDDIQFCMTIKKEMSTDAPETVIKVHLNPQDTAKDIYRKINEEVEKVKTAPLDSAFDHIAQLFTSIPSLLLKFTVWVLKCLDYFGLLPKFLLEVSPFHGSLFFTSMGSLGIPPVYHHLYDFGNMPAFVSFGCKRKELELQKDGTIVPKMYIDCKFSMDERITDGFYFAAFFKHFKHIFRHPEILDNPPEEILQDVN